MIVGSALNPHVLNPHLAVSGIKKSVVAIQGLDHFLIHWLWWCGVHGSGTLPARPGSGVLA